MNKNSVNQIDSARDVHVGDVNHGKKPFDGDYSKSDCAYKEYRYVSFFTRTVLFIVWVIPLVGMVIYMTKDGIAGIFNNNSEIFIPTQWFMPSVFAFALLLYSITYILPFFSDRFKIRFYPKKGIIYVGKKKYYFNDMMDMDFIGGDLIMIPKNGNRRVMIPVRQSVYMYISKCIGRLWNS